MPTTTEATSKTKTKAPPREWTPYDVRPERQFLRTLVNSYYDWQDFEIGAKLRGIRRLERDTRAYVIAAAERGEPLSVPPRPKGPKPGRLPPIELSADQLLIIDGLADEAEGLLEKYAKQIGRIVKSFGDPAVWLEAQSGIGPIMSGYLLSQVDPYRARTPSALWSFFGLSVVPSADGRGHAPHPEKGLKNSYNATGRAKMIGVLGPGILKANVRDPVKVLAAENGAAKMAKMIKDGWEERDTIAGRRLIRGPFVRAYFDYRWRIHSREDRDTNWGYVACVSCTRTFTRDGKDVTIPQRMKDGVCPDCGGTEGQRAGQDKHMMDAGIRYMVKMFLLEFWKVIRAAEGLPVLESYHERERGRAHGARP